MTPDRWKRIEELYHSALQRPEGYRLAYLREACPEDAELRKEVEELLRQESAGNLLEGPAWEAAEKDLASESVLSTRVSAVPMIGKAISHYRILEKIGHGGMGEVYRATDLQLHREVAVKVLPISVAADEDRLRRFKQEARMASMLNHPNILVIYEFGFDDGAPFVVSELLEGATLRELLKSGPLPTRKAVDFAAQIAHGLSAAHGKSIVHRDLKPSNIFITPDGRVKILDFGLAKLTQDAAVSAERSQTPTMPIDTEPGMVLGTIGYMSPEQVRGLAADHRSDIFSLGATLYEMLAGKRAFSGATSADIMTAILKEDPPELGTINRNVSAGLERLVRRCLEKEPEQRFQSASDLGFALEAISAPSTGEIAAPDLRSVRASGWRWRFLVSVVAVVAALAGVFVDRQMTKRTLPSFQKLTFRRGTVHSARFAPDGQTVVYSAAWEGNPVELFSTRRGSPESRAWGLPGAQLLAISPSGEMALLLRSRITNNFISSGTLARMPLNGGAPREILEGVQAADWTPDGKGLSVVRQIRGHTRLEYPIGKILYETAGWISHPRFSPQGDYIAFLDHVAPGDDGGFVVVLDLAGKKKTLTDRLNSVWGLAWAANRRDIWFTAAPVGITRVLYAVTLSGRQRLVTRVAGELTLYDISSDGRLLMAHDNTRQGISGLPPGQKQERELSWLDGSYPAGLSDDGTTLLLGETGDGAGPIYGAYLRKTSGSPAIRLGDGAPVGLSPDGKWALTVSFPSYDRLILLPTGPGEAKLLPQDGFTYMGGAWFPDGQRIAFFGSEGGRAMRLYVRDLTGTTPRAITPEGAGGGGFLICISPDGRWVAALNEEQRVWMYPIEKGEPYPLATLTVGEWPIRFSPDGRWLSLILPSGPPAKIERLELATGKKTTWTELTPSDRAGVTFISEVFMTPDAKSYVYFYFRRLSDLMLVEGVK